MSAIALAPEATGVFYRYKLRNGTHMHMQPDFGSYLAATGWLPATPMELRVANCNPMVMQAGSNWLINFSVEAGGEVYAATIEIQNGTKQKAFDTAQRLEDGQAIRIYVRHDKRYLTPGINGIPREWVTPLWLSPPSAEDIAKLEKAQQKRKRKAQQRYSSSRTEKRAAQIPDESNLA